MAFIREHHLASDVGDPFKFRVPKKIRKLAVGRALGRVGRVAAPFASAALGVLPGGGAALQFARAAGLDIGDPGPPRASKKRKSAGSGPRAKAAKKRDTRTRRALSGAAAAAHAKKGKKGATFDIGKFAKGAGGAALGALQHLNALGITGEDAAKILGGGTDILAQAQDALAGGGADMVPVASNVLGALRAKAFGRHRRTMNPTNVKALRRSVRRLEGFQNVVRRVEKMLPRAVRHLTRPTASSSSRARGHKRGCGCAVCK